jgi:hypothetical protein
MLNELSLVPKANFHHFFIQQQNMNKGFPGKGLGNNLHQ